MEDVVAVVVALVDEVVREKLTKKMFYAMTVEVEAASIKVEVGKILAVWPKAAMKFSRRKAIKFSRTKATVLLLMPSIFLRV